MGDDSVLAMSVIFVFLAGLTVGAFGMYALGNKVDKNNLYLKEGTLSSVQISSGSSSCNTIVTFTFLDNSVLTLTDTYPRVIVDGALTIGTTYDIVYQKDGNDFNLLNLWKVG